MDTLPLTAQDHELIEHAKAVIGRYYRPDHHHVGAALRGSAGTIFTAVHVSPASIRARRAYTRKRSRTMAVVRRQFTVEDYHRMRDAGIFAADDRVELLDGEVLIMSPIGPLHAAIVRRINMLLGQSPLHQYIVSVQDPVQLSNYSEPQPDIAILKYRADFYATAHPRPSDIVLIIEVSDTSLDYDRENKLPRYADSLIAEVWIVNIESRQIEQHYHPAHGKYQEKHVWLHGQSITSSALPALTLQVDDVLG